MSQFAYFLNAGDGTSPVYQGVDIQRERHHPQAIFVTGTFGGATVTAYASADGVTFLPVPGVTPLTAPGIMFVDVTCQSLQLVISGGTSPSITAIVP